LALEKQKEKKKHKTGPRTGSRKQRHNYTVHQKQILYSFFFNNRYPKCEDYELIASQVGIDVERVRIWFNNKRHLFRRT